MSSAAPSEEWPEEITNPGILVPPPMEDVPRITAWNRVVLMSLWRRQMRWERRFGWLMGTVVAGSLTVASSVIASAIYVGQQIATVQAVQRDVERHEARIERLETAAMDERGGGSR